MVGMTGEQFADALDSAVAELREMAESRMRDSCTIQLPGSGAPVRDPATNTSTIPAGAVVYPAAPDGDARCRVQLQQIASDRPLVSGDSLTVVRYVISIPISAPRIPKRSLIIVTAAHDDEQLIGARFRVRSVLRKSSATARRMECEILEVQS